MTASPALPLSDASFHGVQRRLAALLPTESWLDSPAPLELSTLGVQDPPRLISASILEGKTLREYPVIGQPEPRFAAFLDGTQTSRVIAHVDGVPIVYGSVAAVIRKTLLTTTESVR